MRKCWHTLPEDRPTFRELVGMMENLLECRRPDQPPRPKETLPVSPKTPTTPEGTVFKILLMEGALNSHETCIIFEQFKKII